MKKLLLVLTTLLFVSCSSDDIRFFNSQDFLIGTWKPVAEGEFLNGQLDIYNYTVCEQSSRYTFSSNGDFDFISYDDNENTGTCEEIDDGFISGTWQRLSDKEIEITSVYSTGTEIDNLGDIDFINSNVFRVIESSGDYLEFVRVN